MSENNLHVYAPASIGNFAVGFDSLGAALKPISGELLGDVVKVMLLTNNKTKFISCMMYMFKHPDFDYNLFIKKLKIQKTKLVDCGNAQQYKDLIEEIYNYKNKNKVNLRFNNNGK